VDRDAGETFVITYVERWHTWFAVAFVESDILATWHSGNHILSVGLLLSAEANKWPEDHV
jgi:hypothetical protein